MNCIVVVDGCRVDLDMAGVTTSEEANARFAAAGVGGIVRALAPAEAEEVARLREQTLAEMQREREAHEARRRNQKLEAIVERGGRLELSPEEAQHLLNSVRADYLDE